MGCHSTQLIPETDFECLIHSSIVHCGGSRPRDFVNDAFDIAVELAIPSIGLASGVPLKWGPKMGSTKVARSFGRLQTITALSIYFVVATAARGQSASGCTPQALTLAENQLTDTLVYTSNAQFPSETNPANGNKWKLPSSSAWTSGFFPGWIWLMYENTLDSTWLARANLQTATMQSQDTNASTHDIGFKMLGSFGNGYRITRDPEYQQTIVTAANAMATQLYRPVAGVIDSWPYFQNDQHITVIIDNMMNLELLFLGAQYGANPTWYNMAVSHAVKTMENHVRPDGSTYQVVQLRVAICHSKSVDAPRLPS